MSQVVIENPVINPPFGALSHWKTRGEGMRVLGHAGRIDASSNQIRCTRFLDEFAVQPLTNDWDDTTQAGYVDDKVNVVQTITRVIERCLLMTTESGDLVLAKSPVSAGPMFGAGTLNWMGWDDQQAFAYAWAERETVHPQPVNAHGNAELQRNAAPLAFPSQRKDRL